jgi:outer membrane protein assembly factor BamB
MHYLKNLKILILSFFLSSYSSGKDKDTWTDFRGPSGDGIVADCPRNLPTKWSEKENIVWKTEIKGRAWSSPVVWKKQVWVTNSTADGKSMGAFCINSKNGDIIYEFQLFENDEVEPLGNNVNSYGSPSPTIEEGRVYIHFGSYGTVAINTKTGKLIWKRTDLPCRHLRGPGSSPVLFGELLILTMDGADVQYLIALDKKTGKTIWKTDRSTKWDDIEPNGKIRADGDLRKAYSTPTFTNVGGKTIMISPGAKSCFAYDPIDGKEIWNVTYSGYSNASRCVIYKDNVIINTGYGKPHLISIRLDPDARGNITKSHVNWDIFKRVPKRSSPIIHKDNLYMTTDEGILTCLDLQSGKSLWSDRMPGHFSSSPILADGNIYFFSEMGHCYIIKPGQKYQLVSRNELDSGFMASPAVAGKSIYARTKTHLYRIEKL